MKKTITIGAFLLLSTFLASASPLFNINTANATQVAIEWGHLSPTNNVPNEQSWESMVSSAIDSDWSSSWQHQNNYWTYTTVGYVDQNLQDVQYPYGGVTWATTWWVGDYLQSTGTPGHYGFYGDQGQNTFDNNVWQYANNYWWFNPPYYNYWQATPSKQYFNFIWTCTNGGLNWYNSNGGQNSIAGITYPINNGDPNNPPSTIPTNTNTQYGYFDNTYNTGAVGMPLAWTGTAGMRINGYSYSDSGSYAYIGFENHSPNLVDASGYMGLQYGYFPYYFYRYALGQDNNGVHGSIAQSLDYASLRTFGIYYGGSILNNGYWYYSSDYPMTGWWRCQMRVFGNTNMALPY